MEAYAGSVPQGQICWAALVILLLLGTNPYPFDRLLTAVDEWSKKNNEKVIAQTGHTPTDSVSIECHDFVSYDQVITWIDRAEFVICQGGFGSIKDCLERNKAVIASPRLQEYGECMDPQKELVKALAEENRVVGLFDVGKLEEAVKKARSHKPVSSKESAIPNLVSSIVRNYAGVEQEDD